MKKINILKSFIPVLMSINNIASAQEQNWQKAAEELAKNSPIKEPGQIFTILARVLQYTYTAFFIVAVIFIIVAAFNFLTAKDNPEKIKSARSQITWAAVAIAIALLSVGAATIIGGFLSGR